MERALNNLKEVCGRAVGELEGLHYTNQGVPYGRWDQKGWKARLDQIARALDTAGSMLCDWSRAAADPDLDTVGKLEVEVEKLVRHLKRFPVARGRHYLKGLCDAAVAAVNGIERIAFLLPRTAIELIEPYQWNQTRRLKDFSASPIDHLLVYWERWAAQLQDASDEIRKISLGESSEEEDEEFSDDEDAWMRDMLRRMTDSEVAMAKECLLLVKMVRSLFKKIRIKCINCLNSDTLPEIQLIDELYGLGHTIVQEADNLATAVFPVQDGLLIRDMAIRLAKAAQDLADIARIHTGDPGTQQWFESCYHQLDKLIDPVLERTPLR